MDFHSLTALVVSSHLYCFFFPILKHAKRLYPLQVSNKVTLQWAYAEGGDEDNKTWTTVDKSIVDGESLPEGIEKMIGFEGTPDPASGFYCIYDGGQIKK